MVGGILPHLVEESYAHLPQKVGETFFTGERLQPKAEWENFDIERVMELILEIRREINRVCDVGNTLGTDVSLELAADDYDVLKVGFFCVLNLFRRL